MSRPRMTVLRALRENLSPHSRYLLAISGGMDSVALLHGCMALMQEFSLNLEIAHVDHALRQGSRADAEFVQSLAQNLKIPFHLKTLGAVPNGENIENWGRNQRYRFFEELLEKYSMSALLTAHSANDVAETFLMRIIANKELKSIVDYDAKRRILRPLLLVSREEISQFVTDEGAVFREDPTNLDQDFLRNKIRHTLIPFLQEKFDPRIIEVLSQRAGGVEEDIRFLEHEALEKLSSSESLKFGSREWLKEVKSIFSGLPEPLKWRAAEALLKPKLGFNLGRERSRALLRFLMGNDEGLQLSGGVTLRRGNGGIIVQES